MERRALRLSTSFFRFDVALACRPSLFRQARIRNDLRRMKDSLDTHCVARRIDQSVKKASDGGANAPDTLVGLAMRVYQGGQLFAEFANHSTLLHRSGNKPEVKGPRE